MAKTLKLDISVEKLSSILDYFSKIKNVDKLISKLETDGEVIDKTFKDALYYNIVCTFGLNFTFFVKKNDNDKKLINFFKEFKKLPLDGISDEQLDFIFKVYTKKDIVELEGAVISYIHDTRILKKEKR